jgi:hypothetical protein
VAALNRPPPDRSIQSGSAALSLQMKHIRPGLKSI